MSRWILSTGRTSDDFFLPRSRAAFASACAHFSMALGNVALTRCSTSSQLWGCAAHSMPSSWRMRASMYSSASDIAVHDGCTCLWTCATQRLQSDSSVPARHISEGAAPCPCCLAPCPNSLVPRAGLHSHLPVFNFFFFKQIIAVFVFSDSRWTVSAYHLLPTKLCADLISFACYSVKVCPTWSFVL